MYILNVSFFFFFFIHFSCDIKQQIDQSQQAGSFICSAFGRLGTAKHSYDALLLFLLDIPCP